MDSRKIIFVYNADKDLFSMMADYVHKVVDPSTYQCNLCRLTHGNFGMKQEWKAFIDNIKGDKSFLYKNDFVKQYGEQSPVKAPAVYLQEEGILRELFSAAEINRYNSLPDLQQALSDKLENV